MDAGSATQNHAALPEAIQGSEVTGGLCSACRSLFKSIDISRPVCQSTPGVSIRGEDEEPRSYDQIKRSSERGCGICTTIALGWGFWGPPIDSPFDVSFGLEVVNLDGVSRFCLSPTIWLGPRRSMNTVRVVVEPVVLECKLTY